MPYYYRTKKTTSKYLIMYLNEEELAIVFENLKFALSHLTDDFTDTMWVDHYQKDINLLNKIGNGI